MHSSLKRVSSWTVLPAIAVIHNLLAQYTPEPIEPNASLKVGTNEASRMGVMATSDCTQRWCPVIKQVGTKWT